jgi:hypothetical protein
MQRSSYPTGETTASRIKSLALHVERWRGRVDADALISEVKLSRADLEDETRPIGIAIWHRAVEFFAERYGRDALLDTWAGVVADDNLGVWTRVLRGTNEPLDAFKQLDGLGGEEVRTSRWETLSATHGRWHGRVALAYDPRYEWDGLLTLARAAELRAVPAMFGLPPGVVTILSTQRATFASRTGATGQEYMVTWGAVEGRQIPIGAAAGAVAGAGAAAYAPLAGLIASLAGAAAGAAAGLLVRRDAVRRKQATAQSFRLRALERSLMLREDQRAAAAQHEGAVIAGLYRLGEQLGTGASGVIHQATRLSDSMPVAIKLLRPAVAHDAVASDRLRREAEAMGLAWHPNVVELYDHGSLPDGTIYLVMELLQGEPMSARLGRQGNIPPDQLRPIALELCDALGAVHAAGVIHRDVKPSNVFLSRAPSVDTGEVRERVKLLDFGIARVEWAETRLTNFGARLGTPGYMSPEQEEGHEIDSRSDLFALGSLLYEALTGRRMRPGAEPDERDFDENRASGVQRSHPGIPRAWLEVIEKATSHSARDRYPDAKSMRDALAAIPRAQTDVARPPVAAPTPARSPA